MASLFNTQINNTYPGLLKTDNNAAIGSSAIDITDGVGNQTGLSLELGAQAFRFDQANPHLQVRNTNFTANSYPMSGTAGDTTFFEFMDSTGTFTGSIGQDRYGSLYYSNLHAGESHVFNAYTPLGATTPAVIRMDTWNSANNSNNWYTGYTERITAGSYDGGTENLTLTKPDGSDIVVNIPSGGGGGAAGLINGTGANSLKNADSLVATPAIAGATLSIALGDNAKANSSGVVAVGAGSGQLNAGATNNWASCAFGQNANFDANGCIAFGPATDALGSSSIAIGDGAQASGGNAVVIGGSAAALGNRSVSVGYNADVLNGSNNCNIIGADSFVTSGSENSIIAGYANSIPSGFGNTLIGCQAINMPSGQNDNTAIGRISGFGTGTSNSIAIGLVASMGSGANDSVAIGRQAAVGNQAAGSTAIGKNAQATAQGSTAIGANAVAANPQWAAVKQLEINNYATLNFADDAAAAAGGVPLGGIYHNAGALRIRIV